MGVAVSKVEGNVPSKVTDEEQTTAACKLHTAEMDNEQKRLDESRLVEMMQFLQRVIRLQREATSARVGARQKIRQASFKRQDVSNWDAKFMREIQRLTAEGKLDGLDELLRIGEQCQSARNELGPIEQESIEAEQRWEGSMWKLRQAQVNLYTEFAYEFEAAESYPRAPTSVASSEYKTSSSPGTQPSNTELEKGHSVVPFGEGASITSSTSFPEQPTALETRTQILQSNELQRQDSMLLGIQGRQVEDLTSYSDSGIGDIDDVLQHKSVEDSNRQVQPVSEGQSHRLELYPNLLTDFASRRERINSWLENTILVSRLEATSLYTIVKELLEAENSEMPSNWSQLVIAYWELDGAAVPRGRHTLLRPHSASQDGEMGRPRKARVERKQEENLTYSLGLQNHKTSQP